MNFSKKLKILQKELVAVESADKFKFRLPTALFGEILAIFIYVGTKKLQLLVIYLLASNCKVWKRFRRCYFTIHRIILGSLLIGRWNGEL
jgi:hypothetical protein